MGKVIPAMEYTTVLQLIGVLFIAVTNTAFFIWKLVTVRDAILDQVLNTEARVDSRISTMKASIDLQVDAVRREVTEHKVKIAEEYLRKDSFHFAMNKLESTTAAGLAKVEASVIRLDERLANAVSERRNVS